MRTITTVVLAVLLCGCTGTLNRIAKHEAADVDAAIEIATKANDGVRLACYNAIKTQLALQTMVKGPLSQDEALRIGLLNLTFACNSL